MNINDATPVIPYKAGDGIEIYIINPQNGEFVTIAEWRKQENPQSATSVAVVYGDGKVLVISAKNAPENVKFDEIADIQFLPGFRCPTRAEAAIIYDARFAGLDDALKVIGGDPVDDWFWTCDVDTDPAFPTYAFLFSGKGGRVNSCEAITWYTYNVRPVSAYELKRRNERL